MSNPREDLTDILMRTDPLHPAVMARGLYEHMADAIIAAGWSPPSKTYPEHEIDMERFPACTVCGRDVVWNDRFQRWEH